MAEINPFRFSSEYCDDETGLVYYTTATTARIWEDGPNATRSGKRLTSMYMAILMQ